MTSGGLFWFPPLLLLLYESLPLLLYILFPMNPATEFTAFLVKSQKPLNPLSWS